MSKPSRACLWLDTPDPERPTCVNFSGALVVVPWTVRISAPGPVSVENGSFVLLPAWTGFRSRKHIRRCLSTIQAAKAAWRYL